MQGKIIKGIAGFYYVHVAGDNDNAAHGSKHGQHIYECKAKGVFRKNHEKPLVGDDCEMQIIDTQKMTGNIVRILDRKNSLIRPNVANVDQALIIFALAKPEPNFNLLDRFLILMQQKSIPCLLVFNKKDLIDNSKLANIERIYEQSGYPIVFTSAKENEKIEEVKTLLTGKTTTVAGPSGVGKSSIINLLQTGTIMETGEVSVKTARGKHTTRHSELIALGNDSYILDTPGFSSLDISSVSKEELKGFYREFSEYVCECRFADCMHISEPQCGVKTALESGKISKMRYENYRALMEEIDRKKQH